MEMTPEQHRMRLINDLRSEIQALREEGEDQQRIIDHQQQIIHNLNSSVNNDNPAEDPLPGARYESLMEKMGADLTAEFDRAGVVARYTSESDNN